MSDFDRIRPYHDHEVAEVVQRIVNHPQLPAAAAKIIMPKALKTTGIGAWLARWLVRKKTKKLTSVADCQLLIAEYFDALIASTTSGLTVSGLKNLNPGQPYLFISNHRDIVMDSSLMNYLLHRAGLPTCRMAVGDNLLKHELAADLMRLNKSFVIERDVAGTKAAYKVLHRTSRYIRQSIEEGVSVWIAQREGRAKDGWDRTDPAVLKMLGLAHKEVGGSDGVENMVARYTVIPVSVGYELDPCAGAKAHELYLTDRDGSYAKAVEEDVKSIITGLVGQKGRVHIHFGEPIPASCDSPPAIADAIDRSVLSNIRVYPTQVKAVQMLGDTESEAAEVCALPEVMSIFDAASKSCPDQERPFFLCQYANLIKNRREFLAGEFSRLQS